MKNTQLYDEIKRLVHEKHQIPPQSPSFAQKYVQQQLNKKKLIPFDPKKKMNLLMKNFEQLETYVNVKDLLLCIKNRQKYIKVNKSMKGIITNSAKFLPQTSQPVDQLRDTINSLKQKIKENLGNLFAQKFAESNIQIEKVIQDFQMNKISNDQLKNCNTSSNMEKFLKKCTKQNKFGQQQFDFQKFIQDKENIQRHIKSQTNFYNDTKKLNLQQSKQQIDLLHQISTYLQIILESEHKKKWMIAKNKGQANMMNQTLTKKHQYIQENKSLFSSNRKHSKDREKSAFYGQRTRKLTKNRYHKQKRTISEQTQQFIDQDSNLVETSDLKQMPQKDQRLKKIIDRAYSTNKAKMLTSRISIQNIALKLQANRSLIINYPKNSKRIVTFKDNSTAKNSYQHVQNSQLQKSQMSLNKQTSKNCSNQKVASKKFKSSQRILTQKQMVNENFTFRNRNIKQGLLKKLDNFLDLVQQEQKIFKQGNKNHILNIQRLENNLKVEYTKYKDDPLLDQQGFKAVRVRALQFK